MSSFAEQAANILEAAESAGTCSNMTILINQEGRIHMLAENDWPLDSLTWHHGAKAAYRVSENTGRIRVEAREGVKTCVLESPKPAQIARLLLGN